MLAIGNLQLHGGSTCLCTACGERGQQPTRALRESGQLGQTRSLRSRPCGRPRGGARAGRRAPWQLRPHGGLGHLPAAEEVEVQQVGRLGVARVVDGRRVVRALPEHALRCVDNLPGGCGRPPARRQEEGGEGARPAEAALPGRKAAHAAELLGEAEGGEAVEPEVSDDGVEEERRVEEGEIARGVQEAVPGRGLAHRLDY
mmetsp:Transcript_41356/g.137517  ORF Transcript_41356/g.137517 Transcript_41356/m.137517 type:complete len:201 (-) Transcript_41356:1558-2160(-)